MASTDQPDFHDHQEALLARIDATVREINAAQDAVRSLDVGQRLVKRVQGRLDREFEGRRSELLTLASAVKGEAPGTSLRHRWATYREHSVALRPVHAECLAFIQGVLVREAKVDRLGCEIADALLDELQHRCGIEWTRFTILAADELAGDLAGVIRLRFPLAEVWDLPICAHEFGHYAAPRLQTGSGERPFDALLQTQDVEIDLPQEADYASFVHEYFADVFATYTLGACYPAVCIALRFDALSAHVHSVTHPSDATRAYVLLRSLRRLDDGRSVVSHPFRDVADRLDHLWNSAMISAGSSATVPAERAAELDELETRLWTMLEQALEPDARYNAACLRRALDFCDALAGPGTEAPPAERLADVLNGAWMYRLDVWERGGEHVRSAGRRAFQAATVLARRVDDDQGA